MYYNVIQCEMGRWAEVLNRCDAILGEAAVRSTNGSLSVDEKPEMLPQVATVLSFTALLFENTFSRSVYNSMEVSQFVCVRHDWLL